MRLLYCINKKNGLVLLSYYLPFEGIAMVRIVFLFLLSVFLFSSDIISQKVYVTKSGKKYHTSECSSLSKSKISIELNEAI